MPGVKEITISINDSVIKRELADIHAHIDRLTLVAYEAWKIQNEIGELNGPVNNALVDALLALSGEQKDFQEVGSLLRDLVLKQAKQST